MTQGPEEPSGGARLLIGSKLEPPEPPAGLVARTHLIESMDRCRDGRVTLISAPAGYGKTTLVFQCLDADPATPAAWLSLDRQDNDLERFVRYVAAALDRVEKGCLSSTEEMLSARVLPPPQILAESMVLGLEGLQARTVLVLDDYGLVRDRSVHELVTTLVMNLPPNLHLVIMSRIDPALPLSLWRSRHWLHELRAAELRCSREETATFLATSTELELSDEGIEAIHRKTEGWITGLRLALLSLAGSADPEEQIRAFSASDRLVTDYLMEEVLARQPAEIREFLAITSVLERFSPELCDELLAGFDPGSAGQSRELLDRLYRKNLFVVPLGPAHGWYRYHHLFRQLLLERFAELTSAASKVDILRHAGDWFYANGWTEECLTCLLAAGDLDAAEDVIGGHLHEVLARDLSRRTLARWLDLFPSGAERDRLPLLVAASYMRTLRSDYEGVENLLDTIDTVCRNPTDTRQQKWLREFRHDLDSFRAVTSFWNGDVERAHELTSRILGRESDASEFVVAMMVMYHGASLALTGRWAEYLRFVEGAPTGPGAADGPQRLPFLVVKTVVHMYRGELAECRAAASRLTRSVEFAIPKYFEAIGYHLLGVVAYERNQLDEAERHFLAVESRRFEAPALFDHAAAAGLAQVELARGNVAAAGRHAKTARSIAVEAGSSFLLTGSEALEWTIAVATGKPPDVAASPPPVTDFMYFSLIQPSQSWVRAQIQGPSLDTRGAALDVVEAALLRAETHGVTRRVIQLSALRALALDALNRRDEAIAVLEAALRRGADLGLVRSFVDLGDGIRTLLLAVAERHPGDTGVEAILNAFDAPGRQASGPDERRSGTTDRDDGRTFDDLTNRELDVLELLEERLSNKEIAVRLGISAGTIKMHTLNIYRKLGVRNRRQAAAAAVERKIFGG